MENGNNQGFLKPEEKEFQTFYKREIWWIEHRDRLKKIGLGLFIALDVFLLSFVGWKFLDAYIISYNLEKGAVAAMAVLGQDELRLFSQDNAAAPLSLGASGAVASGDETSYDLYGELANPNTAWYATFEYSFSVGDEETDRQAGFILPNEEKVLAVFKATTRRSASVDLILRNVEWHRVDNHAIPDYPTWSAERAIQISEAVFSRGDSDTAAGVSFVAKNQTAFNFWRPSFLVVLWRGGTLGGLIRLSTSELMSGETKTLSARWFGSVPAVTKIDVYPEINLFDSGVYSSLSGEQSLDSRTNVEIR